MTLEEAEIFITEIIDEAEMCVDAYVNEYEDSSHDKMKKELAELKKEMIEKFIFKYLEP
jgi:hypothetical protein